MHLHSYRLENYRRLRDVHVELAQDISIFVGANNSGKTSATQAIQMFLSGSKDRFSLFDFSSHTWKTLDDFGNADAATDATAALPKIVLDLWFEVEASDLYLVMPLLPSMDWQGTQVGVRISFEARNSLELMQRFRARRQEAQAQAAALPNGGDGYVPWPKSLSAYLEKELDQEFEFKYFVLDRARFDSSFRPNAGYEPSPLPTEPGGRAILNSLMRIDCLNAQRHLADPSTRSASGVGRAEDLSKRLSRFYQRNLRQRQDDHSALKALFDSEEGLNSHLMEVFGPTLDRIATLGYPGLHNPRLEIKSGLNPATVMSQDARVHYVVGSGANEVRLPDTYNGLGFKNLIYMVVEILDAQAKWIAEEEKRPPLHLIFIEEPEAHLHAQLQQVFIRNVLSLLSDEANGGATAFRSQVVVTTHSPHILYERGFAPIRYFRRRLDSGEQTSEVLNLSSFQSGPTPKDRDFLQRYLKLTHCDLFFADAAILVEGNVERLLLPLMIEKSAKSLRSASVCILEVGGAFAHRFKELVEFLGITTLVITDLDSVTEVAAADAVDDQDTEFEVPGIADGEAPAKHYGRTCLPSIQGALTANQTLIQWLPRKRTIADLFAATAEQRTAAVSPWANVRVCYQTPRPVTWNAQAVDLCGRTLEEAFGLENSEWCQHVERQAVGLRIRTALADPQSLAEALHKRVSGSHFDKTKFALNVLAASPDEWTVPYYIEEGLLWLKEQVDFEVEQEVEAVAAALDVPAEEQQP